MALYTGTAFPSYTQPRNATNNKAKGKTAVVPVTYQSSGSGGSSFSNQMQPYQQDFGQSQQAISQSNALSNLLAQLADQQVKARKDSYGRVMGEVSGLKTSLANLPSFNRKYQETLLGEGTAGSEQAAVDELQNSGAQLRSKDLDMLRRSSLGANRVGMESINQQEAADQWKKYGAQSDIMKLIADLENQYNPEYDYSKYIPLANSAAMAQGYAGQAQPIAQTGTKTGRFSNETGTKTWALNRIPSSTRRDITGLGRILGN